MEQECRPTVLPLMYYLLCTSTCCFVKQVYAIEARSISLFSLRPNTDGTRTTFVFVFSFHHHQALKTKEQLDEVASKYTFRFVGDSTTRRLAESFVSVLTGVGSSHPLVHERVDFSAGGAKVGREGGVTRLMFIVHTRPSSGWMAILVEFFFLVPFLPIVDDNDEKRR